LQVITRAFRNTPVPIMLAILMEVAAMGPKPRISLDTWGSIVLLGPDEAEVFNRMRFRRVNEWSEKRDILILRIVTNEGFV
jgi:hypothetical protein